MTVQNLRLENILPNPYQTREGEDPLHIKNLALSITEHGMLQIPSGRLAPGQQGKDALKDPLVQLAFGHSRLAAFKLLNDAGNAGFDVMPVNVSELNNNQMFEMAVAENLERKDLTPIEEARAMQRYMVDFKKNSKEVGELFHLSDSAVRNKLRLLGLPQEVQDKLKDGSLTEGAGRELLGWYELPKEWRDYDARYNSKSLEDRVFKDGAGAEYVKDRVAQILMRSATELSKAPWKWDEQLIGEGIIGLCKGCPNNMEREKKVYCTQKACFEAKKLAWIKIYLSQASLLSGIQVIEEEHMTESSYSLNTFNQWSSSQMEALKIARGAQCENLRLAFDDQRYQGESTKKDDYLGTIGFPKARIICSKRSGFCTCRSAVEKGVNITPGEDGKLDTEALKEINRARRAQDKLNNDLMDQMEVATKQAIYQALIKDDLKVWAGIAEKLDYGGDYRGELRNATTVAQIWMLMAGKIAKSNRYYGDPKSVLKQFNKYLAELGLEALPWDLEPHIEEKPEGKPLIEVFKDEQEPEAADD